MRKLTDTLKKRFSDEDIYAHVSPLLQNQPDLLRALVGIMPLHPLHLGPNLPTVWTFRLREFVRKVMAERRKLVGIGWGHQIISLAAVDGGVVECMDSAKLGLACIDLSDKGAEVFPYFKKKGQRIWLHEFHNHEVTSAHRRLRRFVGDLKGFMDKWCNLITIQGHPELNQEAAIVVLRATPEYKAANEEQRAALLGELEGRNDGIRFLGHILYWAENGPPPRQR